MKNMFAIFIVLSCICAGTVSSANAAVCADGRGRAACVGPHGGFAVGPHGYAYDYRGHYGYRTWGQPWYGHHFYPQ
jgi:hypothetical protein